MCDDEDDIGNDSECEVFFLTTILWTPYLLSSSLYLQSPRIVKYEVAGVVTTIAFTSLYINCTWNEKPLFLLQQRHHFSYIGTYTQTTCTRFCSLFCWFLVCMLITFFSNYVVYSINACLISPKVKLNHILWEYKIECCCCTMYLLPFHINSNRAFTFYVNAVASFWLTAPNLVLYAFLSISLCVSCTTVCSGGGKATAALY